jgi:hypothetical protein
MSESWFLEMIKYIPFLKTKRNELCAMGELRADVRSRVCPFFDLHKEKSPRSESKFIKDVISLRAAMERHLGGIDEFYCDNFDIEDDLFVAGVCNYEYLLTSLAGLPVIPVVGIDRSDAHNESVSNAKISGAVDSHIVAFRVTVEDFENFAAVEDEVQECLDEVMENFDSIDLVFDCKVCRNCAPAQIAGFIANFTNAFGLQYPIRRVVIAGSSIPASAADLLKPKEDLIFCRNEIFIAQEASGRIADYDLCFGDYTVVSPYYSDANIPNYALLGVTTAKVIYSFGTSHYFRRGESVKNNRAQYFSLINELCQKNFFRGSGYSSGEDFFVNKSHGIGAECWPSTMLKPEIVSHVTFIALNNPI